MKLTLPRSAPKRAQAGATAVLAAISMVAMLSALMMAVEIGRLYAAHRDLRKLASMAAMDAVRVVGGCDTVNVPSPADVDTRVRDSLQRNGADGAIVAATGGVALGYVSSFNQQRDLQESPADQATSVGVTLSKAFPMPFLPILPGDASRRMTAHAVATQDVIGAVSIGTSLLTLDSSRSAQLNPLIGGLLGGSVSLSLVTYEGLAQANVTLKELAAAAGVATPGDLLDLKLTRNQALAIVGDALSASADAAEHGLGGTLQTLAGIDDPHHQQLAFADFLGVEETTATIIGDLPINALDLLMAVAETAASGYPIALTPMVAAPLGISNLAVTLRIGQPRQIGLGRPGYRADGTPRTRARTSQIFLEIDASVADVQHVLPVAGAVLDVSAIVELAQGSAILREVRCAHSGQPHHELSVDAATGLASVSLGRYNSLASASPTPRALGNLLNLGLLTVRLNPLITIPFESSDRLDFEGPFVPRAAQIDPDADVREIGVGVGSATSAAISGLTSGAANGLSYGGALGGALNLLPPATRLLDAGKLLAPLFQVLDPVIQNVLDSAGVQLGTATVTVQSLVVDQPTVFVKE